jgi:hypothetical protein
MTFSLFTGTGKGGVFIPATEEGAAPKRVTPKNAAKSLVEETSALMAQECSGMMEDSVPDFESVQTFVLQAACKTLEGPRRNFGFFAAPQGVTTPDELHATCTFKLVQEGSVLRVTHRAPPVLTDKKTMLTNFEKHLTELIIPNDTPKAAVNQAACVVSLNHEYTKLEELWNNKSNGRWTGCQDIPLKITNADKFDFQPTTLKLGNQVIVFFSVQSLHEYMKQLKADADAQHKGSARKKRKTIEFELCSE